MRMRKDDVRHHHQQHHHRLRRCHRLHIFGRNLCDVTCKHVVKYFQSSTHRFFIFVAVHLIRSFFIFLKSSLKALNL